MADITRILKVEAGGLIYYHVCPDDVSDSVCYQQMLTDENVQWLTELPAGKVRTPCPDTNPGHTAPGCKITVQQAKHDTTLGCTATNGYLYLSIVPTQSSGYFQYRVITSSGTVMRDWTAETSFTTNAFSVPFGTYTVQVRDARQTGCSAEVTGVVIAPGGCPPVNPCSLTVGTIGFQGGELFHVELSTTGQTGPFTYQIKSGTTTVKQGSLATVSEGLYSFTSESLANGSYTLVVNGPSCGGSKAFTVSHRSTPKPGCVLLITEAQQSGSDPKNYELTLESPQSGIGPFLWSVWNTAKTVQYAGVTTPVASAGGKLAINVGNAPSGQLLIRVIATSADCDHEITIPYNGSCAIAITGLNYPGSGDLYTCTFETTQSGPFGYEIRQNNTVVANHQNVPVVAGSMTIDTTGLGNGDFVLYVFGPSCIASRNFSIVHQGGTTSPTTAPTTQPPTGSCFMTLGGVAYQGADDWLVSVSTNQSPPFYYYILQNNQVVREYGELTAQGNFFKFETDGLPNGSYRLVVDGPVCSQGLDFQLSHRATATTQRPCTLSIYQFDQHPDNARKYEVYLFSPDGGIGPFVWAVYGTGDQSSTTYSGQPTPIYGHGVASNQLTIDVGNAPTGNLLLRVQAKGANCSVDYPFTFGPQTTQAPVRECDVYFHTGDQLLRFSRETKQSYAIGAIAGYNDVALVGNDLYFLETTTAGPSGNRQRVHRASLSNPGQILETFSFSGLTSGGYECAGIGANTAGQLYAAGQGIWQLNKFDQSVTKIVNFPAGTRTQGDLLFQPDQQSFYVTVYDNSNASKLVKYSISGTLQGTWSIPEGSQAGLFVLDGDIHTVADNGKVWRFNGSAFVEQGYQLPGSVQGATQRPGCHSNTVVEKLGVVLVDLLFGNPGSYDIDSRLVLDAPGKAENGQDCTIGTTDRWIGTNSFEECIAVARKTRSISDNPNIAFNRYGVSLSRMRELGWSGTVRLRVEAKVKSGAGSGCFIRRNLLAGAKLVGITEVNNVDWGTTGTGKGYEDSVNYSLTSNWRALAHVVINLDADTISQTEI